MGEYTDVEILKYARNLISDPNHWTQEYFARDKDQAPVGPESEEACSWCLLGALLRAYQHFNVQPESIDYVHTRLITRIESVFLQEHNIVYFNDSAAHAEVLSALDSAIAS